MRQESKQHGVKLVVNIEGQDGRDAGVVNEVAARPAGEGRNASPVLRRRRKADQAGADVGNDGEVGFKVGKNTVHRWLRQFERNGHLMPTLRG